jgi:ankyrin repeat protein
LRQAAARADRAAVEALLAKGADLNGNDRIGWTALHYATINGNEAMVHFLLDAGADPNARNNLSWNTPLSYDRIGVPLAESLLARGGRLDLLDDHGATPLHAVAEAGNAAVVALYLERGAPVKVAKHDGQTALHLAARRGHSAIVRMLVDKGADAHARDQEGRTPLFLAVEAGEAGVLEMLVASPPAAVDTPNARGTTPLMRALYDRHATITQWLLDRGADVKLRAKSGETALHVAAAYSTVAMVQQILDRGADVNAQVEPAGSALDRAEHRGEPATVALLVARGAHVQKFGCTLHRQGSTTHFVRRGGCPSGHESKPIP